MKRLILRPLVAFFLGAVFFQTVAAAAEDLDAAFERAMWTYKFGDQNAAFAPLLDLAERGHGTAQSVIGYMYQTGTGVEQNNRRALKWYLEAEKSGDGFGMNNLGIIYAKGLLGLERDGERSLRLFLKAGDAGYGEGYLNAGKLHYFGEIIKQDFESAHRHFMRIWDSSSFYINKAEAGLYMARIKLDKKTRRAKEETAFSFLKKSHSNSNMNQRKWN